MNKRECAIIMAYTGIVMLSGFDFNIYYKYLSEICGRSIYSHDLLSERVLNEIKEKSKPDFLELCRTATDISLLNPDGTPYTEGSE